MSSYSQLLVAIDLSDQSRAIAAKSVELDAFKRQTIAMFTGPIARPARTDRAHYIDHAVPRDLVLRW